MDFTLKTYQVLLKPLLNQEYNFQTFSEYLAKPHNKTIILRHDVDKLPENSLRFAQIQHELGIKGSYYFRIVLQSFDTRIIEEIANLGHEIGYHYEDVDLVQSSKFKVQSSEKDQDKKIAEKAIELFEKHLAELRKYYPVKTICMHGSPLSKYDNKLLWKFYNFRDFGIIGEPYFDVDFSEVLYLTDTGRRWNGEKVSIRDKVKLNMRADIPLGNKGVQGKRDKIQEFRTTFDIIMATEKEELPNKIMFTFHPQRWTDKPIPWVKELVLQNVKNIVKYLLVKKLLLIL